MAKKQKRDPEVVERFLMKEGLRKLPKGKEIDHKVPLVDGGSDTVRNLQLLTEKQHAAKSECGYNVRTGYRFFCGEPVETHFEKTSRHGIQGPRKFNLLDIVGRVENAEQVAADLRQHTWT